MKNPIVTTYLAPVLQFVLLVGAVLQSAVLDGVITGQEAVQILAFMIAPAVTYLVPLSRGPWPGILKTGLNALLGGLLVLGDILANGGWVWSVNLMLIVGLAILNALAVELGVATRVASARAGITSPVVDNREVRVADSAAYDVAVRHLGT